MGIFNRISRFLCRNRYWLQVIEDDKENPRVFIWKKCGFDKPKVLYFMKGFSNTNSNDVCVFNINDMQWQYTYGKTNVHFKAIYGDGFSTVEEARKYLNLVVWRDSHKVKKSMTMKKQISKN